MFCMNEKNIVKETNYKLLKTFKQKMKENMKQVYLAPAVEVKVVAVENGFFNSEPIMTEEIYDGGTVSF